MKPTEDEIDRLIQEIRDKLATHWRTDCVAFTPEECPGRRAACREMRLLRAALELLTSLSQQQEMQETKMRVCNDEKA